MKIVLVVKVWRCRMYLWGNIDHFHFLLHHDFTAERASVSGGSQSRVSTITRSGPSRRRSRSSPSTTATGRRGSSSASPPGRSSTAWRWWATRWWPAGTTWRGSSATTRRSSSGLSIKTRRTGRPALSEQIWRLKMFDRLEIWDNYRSRCCY